MPSKSKSQPANNERRSQPRAPLGRMGEFFGEARFGAARVRDVSETGLCLEGPGLPQSGELSLSIPLPGRDGKLRRCRLEARVLRTEGERVHLAAKPLRPVNMLQLRDYVWRNS